MPAEPDTQTASPTLGNSQSVISFSEALQDFIGVWDFDAKLSKGVPDSVKAERIMKKAKVPIAKRLGVQYFFGNEVSQSISINEEEGKIYIEAFVKGISIWTKNFGIADNVTSEVKDPLFGEATLSAYYNPDTKVTFLIFFFVFFFCVSNFLNIICFKGVTLCIRF